MEQKNELELLQDELQKVVGVAVEFNVNHTEVANEVGISYDYARQIRNGEKPKQNNEENRKTLQSLIDIYRKEIRRKQDKLNSINVDAQEVK